RPLPIPPAGPRPVGAVRVPLPARRLLRWGCRGTLVGREGSPVPTDERTGEGFPLHGGPRRGRLVPPPRIPFPKPSQLTPLPGAAGIGHRFGRADVDRLPDPPGRPRREPPRAPGG